MLSDDTYCIDSNKDTTHPTNDIDERVGNTEGVVEDEDVEGDVGADGDVGGGDIGEGDVVKGGAVEGDAG
jgi:hypothetical protein